MASITNSFFPISSTPNSQSKQYAISGRKRRPVDPPGEEACSRTCYAPSLTSPPSNKRMKTVDDTLEMLSLRAADPPGHYSQRGIKSSIDVSANTMVDSQQPPAPSCEIDASNNNHATTSSMSTGKTIICNQPVPQRPLQQSTSGISDMSLEGSDINDDDSLDSSSGSISESSIRNSMYQVVFGRMKGSRNVIGDASYDAVDRKIEDLIRRSRIEAVLKSSTSNEKKKDSSGEDTDNSTKSMDLG